MRNIVLLGVLSSFTVVSAGFGQAGGTWQTLAPMPTARQELATAVLNGKIYVLGGFDINEKSTAVVEVYNPNTNTWASAQPLPFAVNHNSAAVAAGKLYSFGGGSLRQVFVYNPASDSWSEVAPMHLGHAGTAAVGVINDKIYVAGGGSLEASSIRDLEVYDPVANTWTMRAPMSLARNHCAGGVIDGKFYVVGGRSGSGSDSFNKLEVYDPQSNSWSSRASMPTARSGIAAAVLNGELWVFGGELPGLRPEVEVFNPASNSWRPLPDMPHARHGFWASVIGNRIYLPGGGVSDGFAASDLHEVFTVDRKATFANISSRLSVETDANVLIGGFIVTGSQSKRVVLRARGPSLPLDGTLADPVLELYNAANQRVAMNDSWQDAPNAQEIIDSTLAPAHDAEAAILTRVAPGGHTAIVRGKNGSTGVGLVEVYDLEAGSESKLANISTRGFVQTGDDVLIGGLILTGSEPVRAIVRAIGPSLPLEGKLANPTLELRDSNGGLVASNDNWRSTQEAEIIATTLAPSSNLESAIVRTLLPSTYTAIVRGAGETSGVGLVEAFALE